MKNRFIDFSLFGGLAPMQQWFAPIVAVPEGRRWQRLRPARRIGHDRRMPTAILLSQNWVLQLGSMTTFERVVEEEGIPSLF